METTKRIFFVHLLNDYSGSPLVLSHVVKQMASQNQECHVFTNNANSGYLSGISGVQYHSFFYTWSKFKPVTLLLLLFSQTVLFCKIAFRLKKGTIVYVNTVLPFGAALAGKLFGAKVIYHIHETSIKPAILKNFLFSIVNFTASDTIYVSKFLYDQEKLAKPTNHVVYNAISKEFLEKTQSYLNTKKSEIFQILMLCSLKEYKGVWDFYQLAVKLLDYRFCLVLNTTEKEIETFFSKVEIPKNLILHPVQKNVHPFYAQSHLLMNLSHPDKWRETFGMTVIEGMAYGLPAIVPPVGGISELVDDWANGFKISHQNEEKMISTIQQVAINKEMYEMLSVNSVSRIQQFSEEVFAKQIAQIL